MPDKVVVDFDVPVGFLGDFVFLAHLNAFHQTQERRAFKFLKLGVVTYFSCRYIDQAAAFYYGRFCCIRIFGFSRRERLAWRKSNANGSIQFSAMRAQTDVPVNALGDIFVESWRMRRPCATGQAGHLYIQMLTPAVPSVAVNRRFCLFGSIPTP